MTEDLDARRQEADVRKLEAEAIRAEIDLLNLDRQTQESLSTPDRARVYNFFGDINRESVKDCISQLQIWSLRDPGQSIEIFINSTGGTVLDGLALYDYITQLKANGSVVNTVGIGQVASMAAIVLQAGTARLMGGNSYLLLHEVRDNAGLRGPLAQLEENTKFMKSLQNHLLAILTERSNLTERQITARWKHRDYWIDAGQSLRLGLVDGIK